MNRQIKTTINILKTNNWGDKKSINLYEVGTILEDLALAESKLYQENIFLNERIDTLKETQIKQLNIILTSHQKVMDI
jgi:hypothetical protein